MRTTQEGGRRGGRGVGRFTREIVGEAGRQARDRLVCVISVCLGMGAGHVFWHQALGWSGQGTAAWVCQPDDGGGGFAHERHFGRML